MRIIISCIFILVLSSCTASPSPTPSFVPTFSQTPPMSRTDTPSTATVITATPTLDNTTIILTPDDLFALPGLKEWSTPDAEDFCEHLPPPQIITHPDGLFLLSGKFALCIRERMNIAMDLDTGSFVSSDDERGDIALQNTSASLAENVIGWNNAYISDAYVLEKYANHSGANHLSYAYCENLLRGMTDPGAMGAEEAAIACVRTTEGRIALLRVEKTYPVITLSVEFSFVVLRKE